MAQSAENLQKLHLQGKEKEEGWAINLRQRAEGKNVFASSLHSPGTLSSTTPTFLAMRLCMRHVTSGVTGQADQD